VEKLKKVGKWLGIGLGVVVLAIAVLAGIASMSWSSRVEATHETVEHDFEIPELTDENRAEAERLYLSRGCGECHQPDGAGQVLADIPPFLLAPPNITVVARTLSASDLHALVRRGVHPDGKPVFFMPAHEYARMPDHELGLIIAHVRSLPESDESQPRSQLRLPGQLMEILGVFDSPMLPAEALDLDASFDPAGPDDLGEYLSTACQGCHGRHLSGGPIPGAPEDVTGVPANLTPHETGLSGWDLEKFTAAIREGQSGDGRTMDTKQMPWGVYKHLSDDEIAAIFEHLQGLEPRPFGGR
jgi:cytochrome c553